MIQLSLFENKEKPLWEDITLEWLFSYLNNLFPKMKWTLNLNDVMQIRQNISKKANLSFSITDNAPLTTWENPKLIHIHFEKRYKEYAGVGLAVNNFDDFEVYLTKYIVDFEEYIGGIK